MFHPADLRIQFAGFIFLAVLALAPSLLASQTAPLSAAVKDVNGRSHRLFDSGTKAAVLIFVTNDCPISNSYMPEINRIVAHYAPLKVASFAVLSLLKT